MNAKLDAKLREYEKRHPIADDADLSRAVEKIMRSEERRVFGKRDYDLIRDCAGLLLELRGLDTEELGTEGQELSKIALNKALSDERKPEFSYGAPRLKVVLRAIPVLVALIAALALSVAAVSGLFFTKSDIVDHEPGETFEKNGWEVYIGNIIRDDIKSFDDLSEYIEKNNYYLPINLNEDYTISKVSLFDYLQYTEVLMIIDGTDGRATFEVDIGKQWSVGLVTETIGRFDVHTTHYDDIYQGEFEYADSIYCVTAKSEKDLIIIIESMGLIE